MKKIALVVCVVVLLSCCVYQGGRTPEGRSKRTDSAVMNVSVLQEEGGRVSWLHHEGLIAFDKKGDDGYGDVYLMSLDGSGAECLTCDKHELQLHNGNPVWHPLGEYIVFQAQDPDLKGLPPGPVGDYAASPGVGINNNIWAMTADGSKFWQLTQVKDRQGVWIMNADGSGKRRLSGFNDPYAPEYIEVDGGIGLGDFDMGPDGKTIVAKMRRGRKQVFTVLIEFNLFLHTFDNYCYQI